MAVVRQVMALLERIAPAALADDWDNPGLLSGAMDMEVRRVYCCLDLTPVVLEAAKAAGCEMIVGHHPILFRGRKNLREDDAEGRLLCALVRSGIAYAAAHTNFDLANPGINTALAAAIGLQDIEMLEQGVVVGRAEARTLTELKRYVESCLGDAVRTYGSDDPAIRRIAVMGGSAGEFWPVALAAGAGAYVTGEIGYHQALTAVDSGLRILEAGHEATEKPGVALLAGLLREQAKADQLDIEILTPQGV